MNSFIYSLVPSMSFAEHLLCPGPVLVTQDNYELLSLIPLPYGLDSRQKNTWKTKQYLHFALNVFFFSSSFFPLPSSSLSPFHLNSSLLPHLRVQGDEEMGTWSGRLI